MTVNGCDLWFDGTWKACCDAHDVAFTNGGNLNDLIVTNWNVFTCVWNLSPINAIIIGIGVTVGGWFVFPWAKLGYKSIYERITGKVYDD